MQALLAALSVRAWPCEPWAGPASSGENTNNKVIFKNGLKKYLIKITYPSPWLRNNLNNLL